LELGMIVCCPSVEESGLSLVRQVVS